MPCCGHRNHILHTLLWLEQGLFRICPCGVVDRLLRCLPCDTPPCPFPALERGVLRAPAGLRVRAESRLQETLQSLGSHGPCLDPGPAFASPEAGQGVSFPRAHVPSRRVQRVPAVVCSSQDGSSRVRLAPACPVLLPALPVRGPLSSGECISCGSVSPPPSRDGPLTQAWPSQAHILWEISGSVSSFPRCPG